MWKWLTNLVLKHAYKAVKDETFTVSFKVKVDGEIKHIKADLSFKEEL